MIKIITIIVFLCRYCVAGTIGHKLMSGKPTKIELDQDTRIDVQCQVYVHLLSTSYNLHYPQMLWSNNLLYIYVCLYK